MGQTATGLEGQPQIKATLQSSRPDTERAQGTGVWEWGLRSLHQIRALELRTEGSAAINEAKRKGESISDQGKLMCKGPKARGSMEVKEMKES